jgi:hypothetical protein
MKGLLAVTWREIVHRRMLFVAALIAAVAPFAVPWLHGLHGVDAADVRGGTALALSLTFLFGATAFIGGTRLPRAIAERGIGFDLARPLSTPAIWGGTLAATLCLAIGSGFIAFAPAGLIGDAPAWKNLVDSADVPLPWPIVVIGAVLLLFGLFGAAGIALRAHSPQLVADLVLLTATLAAGAFVLFRLQWAGVSNEVMIRALLALGWVAVVALLIAGFAAVSRGRADIRAANRAQSVFLWATTTIGLLGLYAYGAWLLSAPPSELRRIQTVDAAAAGPWVYVVGEARGAEAHFLDDIAGGRFTRVPWGTGGAVFSDDGLVAGWIERLGRSERLRIVELNAARPRPRTGAALAKDSEGLVLDAHGARAAIFGKDGISVFDLRTGRLIFSARIAEYTAFPRAFFLDPDRLRIYWCQKDRFDIFEADLVARKLVQTGSITGLKGWPILATDRLGRRLACNEFEAKRLRLFDARSGDFLKTLTEGDSFAGPARFLADDRIVALAHRGGERLLEVFSPSGAPVRAIPLPGGTLMQKQRSTALGGEVSPGALALATGEPGNTPVYLVSLNTGSMQSLNLRGRPVSRWVAFFGRPNAVPAPGSPSTTLFQTDSGELVRLDPATGERRVILGKPSR